MHLLATSIAALLAGACGPLPSANGVLDPNLAAPSVASPTPACQAPLRAPPVELGLDPFYVKYLDVDGLPLVGSGRVRDAAFPVTCEILRGMLAKRRDLVGVLARAHVRVGIIAQSEVTTDMPEHADLDRAYPGTDWNVRARGLGATEARPLSSVGEENVLHLDGDAHAGENIFVHEFGHTLFDLGIAQLPDDARATLDQRYAAALAAGTFAQTYAAVNASEYWAEGVQSFYDVNLEAMPPDGIHGAIDTRAELAAADPGLYALIATYLDAGDWRPR